MAVAEWTVKAKLVALDKAAAGAKNKWEQGDVVIVSIAPHATINMMKQRIAMIVRAHTKHQEISVPDGPPLDDLLKLQDIEGVTNGCVLHVSICVPAEVEAPPVELSDDEGLCADEEEEFPEMPTDECSCKDLSDADMDKQCELKQESQEALEDGDLTKSVQKLTEALLMGGVSAMMFAKRAELLVKQKRYRAAIADASRALTMNPDSTKAFRARGKAYRLVGDYEKSAADLSQAQSIDYDDGTADIHSYVKNRWAKMQLKAKQDDARASAMVIDG